MKFIRKNGRIIPIKDKGESDSSKLKKAGNNYAKAGKAMDRKGDKMIKSGNKKALIGGAIGALAGGLIAKKFGISAGVGAFVGMVGGAGVSGGESRIGQRLKEEGQIYKSEGKKITHYSKKAKLVELVQKSYSKTDKLKKLKKKGSSV